MLLGVVIYTIAVRVPAALSLLEALQLASSTDTPTLLSEASTLKLPSDWKATDGYFVDITDVSMHLSKKLPGGEWQSADVLRCEKEYRSGSGVSYRN